MTDRFTVVATPDGYTVRDLVSHAVTRSFTYRDLAVRLAHRFNADLDATLDYTWRATWPPKVAPATPAPCAHCGDYCSEVEL